MPYANCFKSGLAFDCVDLADETMAFKCGEGTVDGVQGNRRDFPSQTPTQNFCRWMVLRHDQFSVYLQALMGEPEAGLPAGGFEGGMLFLDPVG